MSIDMNTAEVQISSIIKHSLSDAGYNRPFWRYLLGALEVHPRVFEILMESYKAGDLHRPLVSLSNGDNVTLRLEVYLKGYVTTITVWKTFTEQELKVFICQLLSKVVFLENRYATDNR